MKILHIDSSLAGDSSTSKKISAAIVHNLVRQHPGAEVVYRDLGAHPLPHMTLADLADHTLVDEFLSADAVVIGAPMYNFTIPTNLKAWMDRIAIAGKTFQYSGNGPAGLAGGRKVFVASTRGGFYGPTSPIADYELQDRYLRTFFGFLGISDVIFIPAEGMGMGPEQKERALNDAIATAALVSV